jgi:hypothetical protein
MAKGRRISEQSHVWWHKTGFSYGAQTVLNELKHYLNLTASQRNAVQEWISKDLREWADLPDENYPLEPPDFPSLG